MEKDTYMRLPAKAQREVLFDEIRALKQGLKRSAFFGGFVSVFTVFGGAALAKFMFWK